MSTLAKLLQAAQQASRRPLPLITDERLEEKAQQFLDGCWTLDDTVEVNMDETSMAASVGTGPACALGDKDDEDEKKPKHENLIANFIRVCGAGPHRPGQVRKFLDEMGSGLPDSLVEEFIGELRGKGYVQH